MQRRAPKTRRLAIGATAAIAIAAGAAGGIVIVRRRGAGNGPSASTSSGRTPVVEADQRYACDCGATYGTTGAGRHRVFWPADGTPADAILEDHCPDCGRPWPTEEALATA